MQDKGAVRIVGSWPGHRLFLPFVFALLGALAPQQFAVDVGNLFEVILQLMVVVDPSPNLVHFLLRHGSTGGAAWPQGNRQVPIRPVPFSFGTFASGVSASDVPFQQRPSKNLRDWWQLLRKALAALAQSQFGEPA
jgi:hypothetical protein